MPFLKDIKTSAVNSDDPMEHIDSLKKQLNDWGRTISNEKRTEVYKDNSGTNRIIIGVLPDETIGIVISKDDIDVLTAFS